MDTTSYESRSDAATPARGAAQRFLRWGVRMVSILLSVSGFVPENATLARITVMAASVGVAYYLGQYQPRNQPLAVLYALSSILSYVGFLFLVLQRNGARLWIIRHCGEENAFLVFQAILGFLFFHNGIAIGYAASSSPGRVLDALPGIAVLSLAGALFIMGCITKLWAATAVSIDIYYWKDMFLGRKVCDFVETGPYKFLSNPMYGVGQLQAYAIAIWYGSPQGLLIALINQCCVFLFYFLVEEPFIQRVYVKPENTPPVAFKMSQDHH